MFVQRSVDLALDAQRLWELIATADGWRQWLVDDAQITADGRAVAAGDFGVVAEGDRRRHVSIVSVTAGREVVFAWGDVAGTVDVDGGDGVGDDGAGDGAARPAEVSTVTLRVDTPVDGSGSRLVITETYGSAINASGAKVDASSSAVVDPAWERRVLCLWAACVAAALVPV